MREYFSLRIRGALEDPLWVQHGPYTKWFDGEVALFRYVGEGAPKGLVACA